jgi:hypothetical protein
MAVPRLIVLLNDRNHVVRSSTVSALTKLAGHGEFISICDLDIANLQ